MADRCTEPTCPRHGWITRDAADRALAAWKASAWASGHFDRPLTDAEVRLVVMRWADREGAIARRSLRTEANRVRRELGLPTIEGEAFALLGRAVSSSFGRIAPVMAAFAEAVGRAVDAEAARERYAAHVRATLPAPGAPYLRPGDGS